MEKKTFIGVCAVTITLVIVGCLLLTTDVNLGGEDTIVEYEYEMANVSLELDMTLVFNGTGIPMHIILECESFYLSAQSNDDGSYDLSILIIGLHVNASIETDGVVSGGTLVLDYLSVDTVVDELTPDSIRDAVSGAVTVTQWVEGS